jgi:tetratricopeptide (TPR) repeat protein
MRSASISLPLLLSAFLLVRPVPEPNPVAPLGLIDMRAGVAVVQEPPPQDHDRLQVIIRQALEIADLVKEPPSNVRLLTDLAVAQSSSGDHQAARHTLQRAIQIAAEIEPRFRAFALWPIPVAQVRAGDLAGALETAASIRSAFEAAHDEGSLYRHKSLLADVSVAEAETGDLKGALQITDDILEDGAQTIADALLRIARVAAKAGDLANARLILEQAVLAKDLSDAFEYDRHHGNIAHKLARKEPATAERILGMMKEPPRRDQWAVRVCHRMAPVDLARAKQIAALINDPYQKAYAHCVMAQALSALDKKVAAELLDDGFGVLSRLVDDGRDRYNGAWCACTVAAALLPTVESVDPELVPEFLWRAMSFRLPRSGQAPAESGLTAQADATLTMMLARYDRSLAHAVLDPIIAQLRSLIAGSRGRGADALFVAAALIDPRWAVELFESVPDESSPDVTLTKNFARVNVTKILTLEGNERWQQVQKNYFALWIVDSEDL